MFYVYLIISAAAIPLSDLFLPVLRESYSWWLVPVMFIGIFLALVILHIAVLALSIQLINLSSPPERFSNAFRKLIDLSLPLLFKLAFVKIEVSGEEKIPTDTRFLLVCNHLNDIDPAVIMCAFPWAKLAFIGKKEIYTKIRFVAKAMHKLRGLPIDRENNREAVRTIINAANLIKDDIVSIGIFPEGYTSLTGELQPMRNGAFKIAYKANVPIVVCTVDNTALAVKQLFRKVTTIHLDVIDVISTERMNEMTSVELGDIVFNEMQENINKRRAENK